MAELTPKGRSQGDRKEFDSNQGAIGGMAPPGAGGGPPPSQGDPEALMAAMASTPTDRLRGPSTRPNEPLTAGLDVGAGPDSRSQPSVTGSPPPDPSAAYLTPYLPAIEMIASIPGASMGMRQWARRLRAAQPPGAQKNSPNPYPPTPGS